MRDNAQRGRFEREVDGEVVFADYRRWGDTLVITHVEAPPGLRGTGEAGRLMQEIAEMAKRQNLRITPWCGYAAAWLRRHKEYHSLTA